tara:strand:+ start:24654 stop:25031 length:378 start_codon:yes stop_codon:yes gene_type:complete
MIELTLCLWLREFAGMLGVVPNIFAINLPKTALYPALKVSTLNNGFSQTFDGLTGEQTAMIQLDYWAKSTDEIKAIKAKLVAFFDELAKSQSNILTAHDLREQPSFEPNQDIFKQTLELTISYKD